ncbi:glycosyltransferase, partial [Pseudomonas sp. 2995-1]|uniref:glycosyltransferase n=1 Tax=Pseudomonas sp. 2995-1 TaxID=1712679 RepID=UPI001179C77C
MPIMLNVDTNKVLSNTPFVSVIVAAKNEEKSIEKCIKSLLEQSYTKMEIIIVNDRSSDNTGVIIDTLKSKLHDKKLKIIHIEHL